MSRAAIDELCRAVLLEGNTLYPYRRSSLKNARPMAFGSLYPRAWSEESGERHAARGELVVAPLAGAALRLEVRFLQLTPDDSREQAIPFALEGLAPEAGWELASADGTIAVAATSGPLDRGAFKLTVTVENRAPSAGGESPEAVTPRVLFSCQVLLTLQRASFVSLIDAPPRHAELAATCRNNQLWPVLVGEPGSTDTLLLAPIILYDYPHIAPQSPGDLCDGTEIDEILSLRIRSLAPAERLEIQAAGGRSLEILQRAEALGREGLHRLHATLEGPPPAVRGERLRCRVHGGGEALLGLGDAVRLRPDAQGDAFDLMLAGKLARIVAIERDFEDRVHLGVTIDADPGADLGVYAHRFFFRPVEVEPQ